MKRLYRVTVEHVLYVMAEDEVDARLEAKWRLGEEEPVKISPCLVPRGHMVEREWAQGRRGYNEDDERTVGDHQGSEGREMTNQIRLCLAFVCIFALPACEPPGPRRVCFRDTTHPAIIADALEGLDRGRPHRSGHSLICYQVRQRPKKPQSESSARGSCNPEP